MKKNDLREKIILDLLIGRHMGEDANSDLVKSIENDFYRIIRELEDLNPKEMDSANRVAGLMGY